MSVNENNKRIAKNTLMLYFRQVLILLVSLYTVRVVLNTLGVEDYGIYSVVGGIVSFFSFLSGSMASATQRFFSFSLGQNDAEKLKKTFSVNLVIYISIALIAFILLETIGLWFVNNQLKVPQERFDAVIWIFHFSILTFVASIFTTPFMAIIIAHEDMQIYAYVSIVEAVMKLAVVFLLVYLPFDKLELYGTLLFMVAVIIATIYIGICIRKYRECQFRKFYWDSEMFREITGFTGWTLFGQTTTVARNQAVTILLNQFFNPTIVAARAIATNITTQINLFSNNFNVGLYPPIIKAYAANEREEMFSLIFNGSKITFFLMWVFALPMFLGMDMILNFWLKTPPPEAVLFTRLALVEVLINSISLPIATAARAPGKMRTYELTLGLIQFTILLFDWIALKLGYPAHTVFIIAAIINLLMFFVRLIIVQGLIGLPLVLFFKRVVMPVSAIILMSAIPSWVIHHLLPEGFLYTLFSLAFSFILASISMYFIGLNKVWRDKVRINIISRISKQFRFS